jgi:hypothetical protein
MLGIDGKIEFPLLGLPHKIDNTLLTIPQPNLDLISCWWNLKSLAFNKEEHGWWLQNIMLDLDGEIECPALEINAWLLV